MSPKTLGDVRPSIARVAGTAGLPVNDELVTEYVNTAIEELSSKGDFPGVVDQWLLRFDEMTGLLALPAQLERLLAVTVDDAPLEMRSPWFEFVQYGPGTARDRETDSQGNVLPARRDWNDVVLDRGESCTRVGIPVDGGPYFLRLTPLVAESQDRQFLFYGNDASGHVQRTQQEDLTYLNGEAITITSGTGSQPVDGLGQWSSLVSIVKPATDGPVLLEAVPVLSGPAIVGLSTFEGWETRPSYRRYFIPALYREQTGVRDRILRARCRRRFQPVVNDTDILMIGNLKALQAMVISQYKADIGEVDAAQQQVARAVRMLQEEAIAYSGKSRVPSITFQRGFMVGEMPALR